MAHIDMLKPDYKYVDDDINAIVKAVREKTKNPFVIIFDVVNGQDSAPSTDPRSIQQSLSKKYRKLGENLLFRALIELAQNENLWEGQENNRKGSIKSFLEKYDKGDAQTKDDERFKQSIEKTLEETHYNRQELLDYLSEQENDLFDKISKAWQESVTENLPFRILFPVNLGLFQPEKQDSGNHWVLGEIILKKKDKNVTVEISKYDTFGGVFSEEFQRAIRDTITTRLKEELPKDVVIAFNTIPDNYPRKQAKQSNDCGPITCDNLELRAQDKAIPREEVSKGAEELRQKQYEIAKGSSVLLTPKINVAQQNGKWHGFDKKEVKEIFQKVFQANHVHNANLKDDYTVETTDLTDKNLEAFVKSTKALIDGLKNKNPAMGDLEVEVNAPADKKQKLIELCKKYGIKLTGEAKPEPVKSEPERMVDAEAATHRTPVAAI